MTHLHVHPTTSPLAPPDADAPHVPAVEIRGVTRRYGGKLAVAGLDLSLAAGSICGLVGPNGAGKSTTIAMLLGMLPPTTGRISVLGLDPTRDAFALRQRIGYVPEQHHIYDWMKVRQVLRFTRRLYPTWRDETCDRLVAALDLPIKQRVKTLSRGQVAKLALTIALAHHPRLLILDEPTSGLDPIVRREVLTILHDLIGGDRLQETAAPSPTPPCTVLFSTHILSDVERIADRVLVMNHGRLIADESVDSLRRRFVKVSLLFPTPPPEGVTIPGALRVEKFSREWIAVFPEMDEARIRELAASAGVTDVMRQPVSLDDAFTELVSGGNSGGGGAA